MNDKDFLIEDGVLLRYTGSSEKVIVPDGITEIDTGAFFECVSMSELILPKGLTGIFQGAFKGCIWLRSVKLPSTLVYIGDEAFRECESLQEIVIPEGVGALPQSCFSNCLNLRRAVLPDGLGYIAQKAFSYCIGLKDVKLGNALKEIDFSAFDNCTALASLKLPQGLECIGRNAFYGCRSLADISIPDTVKEIGQSAFYNTAFLNDPAEEFVIGGDGILIACKSENEILNVPAGVKTVGELAFAYNEKVKKAVFHEGMTKICKRAFERCTALREVILPDSLKTIEDRAFDDCSSLSHITLPDNIEMIGIGVFDRTPLLKDGRDLTLGSYLIYAPEDTAGEVIIPDDIRVIAGGAFDSTRGLTSVKLTKAETIGESAFGFCSALETAYLSESVQIIGQNAFRRCNKLHAYLERAPLKIDENAFEEGQVLTFLCAENGGFTVQLLNPMNYSCPEHMLMCFFAEPSESFFMQLHYSEYMIPISVCYAERINGCKEYLRENITQAVKFAVDTGDSELLGKILGFGFLSQRQAAECAAYAIEQKAFEQQIMIMRCKQESFGSADETYIDSKFDW